MYASIRVHTRYVRGSVLGKHQQGPLGSSSSQHRRPLKLLPHILLLPRTPLISIYTFMIAIYVYTYVCIYVYVYIYIYNNNNNIYVCIYVYMYVYVCIRM